MPISDKEQIQIVKSWWKEYGYYILFTVVFFMIANFSWQYWQRQKHFRLENASMIYTQMLSALEQQKGEESKLFGEQLIKKYSSSPYASLAALILAKDAVSSGNLKMAQEKLQFVIKKAPSKTLRQLARIRVARVLIAIEKPREALDLLTTVDDKSYDAEVNEAFGDALLALDKTDEAEKAYRKAQHLSVNKAQSPLLKMKLQQF